MDALERRVTTIAPGSKGSAITRASVIDGSRGRDAQWRWYYACIRDMLRDSGCPPAQCDDIAHDLILERLEAICRGYDRSKGRFRPYLYRCVVNAWRDRQRAQRSVGSLDSAVLVDDGPAADASVDTDAAVQPGLGELSCFLDQLFARFLRDKTRKEIGFFLLRDWCMTGRDIEEALRANHLRLAPAYARKLRAQASADFARFAEEHVDPDDLADMLAECDQDRPGGLLATLSQTLRWPSEDKRLGIMARILRHLYRKYQAHGRSFDEL